MVETVIAVLVLTSVFLCLFRLAYSLTGKILLEHAAMRVARARTVGFNDFMCRKTARVAVIPVAGKRLWPEGDEFDYAMERASVRTYMGSPDGSRALGILDYERWHDLVVEQGDGTDVKIGMKTDWFDLEGQAGLERNCDFYLEDQGR